MIFHPARCQSEERALPWRSSAQSPCAVRVCELETLDLHLQTSCDLPDLSFKTPVRAQGHFLLILPSSFAEPTRFKHPGSMCSTLRLSTHIIRVVQVKAHPLHDYQGTTFNCRAVLNNSPTTRSGVPLLRPWIPQQPFNNPEATEEEGQEHETTGPPIVDG